MPAVPPWISFATPAIALLALIVATLSLVTTRRTYKRAGASILVEFALIDLKNHEFAVSLFNEGLAKVQIARIVLHSRTRKKAVQLSETYELKRGADWESREKCGLPIWIEGGGTRAICSKVDPSKWLDSQIQRGDNVAIELGNGQIVRAPLQWP